jgi:DNA-binding response OmpR family regulator
MRVLVVEDDQALGAFLTKGLEAEGHRVQWAQDGETALVMAAADPADLLVLDLGLPSQPSRFDTTTQRSSSSPAETTSSPASVVSTWEPTTAS